VYLETGDLDRALALQREALALRETALGVTHPLVAASLDAVAEVLCRAGRAREAVPYNARAVAILESTFGTDHANTRWSRAYGSLALLDLGKGHEAIAPIEKALPELAANDPDRVQLLFGLARALTSDRIRALAAAREARALAVAVRPYTVPAIDRWLAAHAK
jgi:eukaryotic-like serine/threonine-protein kinase